MTFGIVIHRSQDNLTAYSANTTELGQSAVEVHAGDEFDLDFAFAAHLTRGVYTITLHAKDLSDGSYLDYVIGRAVFNVQEQSSYDGLADLGLTFALNASSYSCPTVGALLTTPTI